MSSDPFWVSGKVHKEDTSASSEPCSRRTKAKFTNTCTERQELWPPATQPHAVCVAPGWLCVTNSTWQNLSRLGHENRSFCLGSSPACWLSFWSPAARQKGRQHPSGEATWRTGTLEDERPPGGEPRPHLLPLLARFLGGRPCSPTGPSGAAGTLSSPERP